jgi:hypothetical protein
MREVISRQKSAEMCGQMPGSCVKKLTRTKFMGDRELLELISMKLTVLLTCVGFIGGWVVYNLFTK